MPRRGRALAYSFKRPGAQPKWTIEVVIVMDSEQGNIVNRGGGNRKQRREAKYGRKQGSDDGEDGRAGSQLGGELPPLHPFSVMPQCDLRLASDYQAMRIDVLVDNLALYNALSESQRTQPS